MSDQPNKPAVLGEVPPLPDRRKLRKAITDLAKAQERIDRLEETLEWYADQMCEGWCDKDPVACKAIGHENCAGCPARAALGDEQ